MMFTLIICCSSRKIKWFILLQWRI